MSAVHFRSEDQIQLVEFICASMATDFGPVGWATNALKNKNIFDFKVMSHLVLLYPLM